MSKGILVGNGFSSTLINDYKNENMKVKMGQSFPLEFKLVNELFDKFRMDDVTEDEVTELGGGLCPSENLFPSEELYPRDNRIIYNDKIKLHIHDKLTESGFENCTTLYDEYFLSYGLVFEVARNEIDSIESILKVISIFKSLSIFDDEKEKEIKKYADMIYYNDGKYGLKDSCLSDFTKIRQYFNEFNYIFTTNYDLILDDICENDDKVYHLHGGFNIEHPNVKSSERLTPEEAFLVWGPNGEIKYKELSAGFDFNNLRFDAVRFDQSLLADYFDMLENNDMDEMHIFGYSGENDQHINKRISKNKNIKTIYYYCNPYKITDKENRRVKEIFLDSSAQIKLLPWTEVWNLIESN